MKQLLIVAHGSRIASSNDEVRLLAKKVGASMNPNVNDISVAFLELAEPSIETSLNNSFNNGFEEITVLPYFLSGGNHVIKDVPREVAQVMEKWPNKTIRVLEHIGASEAMVKLISEAY